MKFFKDMLKSMAVMSLCIYLTMFLVNTFFQFVELLSGMSHKDAFLLLGITMAISICAFTVWAVKEDD
nr:MAG TPA: hypothetical protein [Caudoviricetes sp.]